MLLVRILSIYIQEIPMAKKQKTFEQKMSKGHALNDKFIKVVCSVQSEETWKFKEMNVRIPEGQTEEDIINNHVAQVKATA